MSHSPAACARKRHVCFVWPCAHLVCKLHDISSLQVLRPESRVRTINCVCCISCYISCLWFYVSARIYTSEWGLRLIGDLRKIRDFFSFANNSMQFLDPDENTGKCTQLFKFISCSAVNMPY